ncbi:hypothetical protein BGX31_009089, partial [Mortierella sp. GBA43]
MQRLALLTHHQLTRAREEKEKEEKEKEKEEKEKEKEGKEKKEKRLNLGLVDDKTIDLSKWFTDDFIEAAKESKPINK